MSCLEWFRQVLKACIDLLKEPFQPAWGLCSLDPPTFFDVLFLFQESYFCMLKTIEFARFDEKNCTMIQGSKNVARWWPFVACSLRIDPFRDVPGLLVIKLILMGRVRPRHGWQH